jgi:FkbM family methyltransferase
MFYDRFLGYLNRNNVRGKDRLYKMLIKRGFKKSIVMPCKFNLQMYLNPYEYIDSMVIKNGFYESEVTNAIISQLQPDETFWDVGANIGLQSLAVKKQMPGINVVAFEPNPLVAATFVSNAKLNELQLQLCDFALSEKEGSADLFIVRGNSGMSSLTQWNKGYQSSVTCQMSTGDSLIKKGYGIPAVIKIDTEGSELSVLKGCPEILADQQCRAVILEADNELLNQATSEILALLQQAGFNKISKLDRIEPAEHNLSNFMFAK